MRILWTSILMGIWGAAWGGAAHAQDMFDNQQQAAVAKNPPGVTCTLRLADARPRFQQGATIRVVAAFTSAKAGMYSLCKYWQPRPSMVSFGDFFVSPQVGVSDPLEGVNTPTGFGYSGPGPTFTPLTDKAAEVQVTLNEWLRFDRPGTYRVYLTARRVVAHADENKDEGIFPSNLAVTSNLLSIEIVPADPAWAHVQALAAVARLTTRPQANVPPPEADLCYLGTHEAAQAMLRQMGEDKWPRSSESTAWRWRQCLIGFPDRPWLVAEMEKMLAEPNYAVTQGFLDTLSLLSALQQRPAPTAVADVATAGQQKARLAEQQRLYAEQSRQATQYWLRTAETVSGKLPAARAMTLHTLLETAWHDGQAGHDAAVQRRVPQLVTALAPILDQLPPLPLEYLLGDEWLRVRNPAFLPALRRLWDGTGPPPEGQHPDLADLLLRRICELDPASGAALALAEIDHPQRHVSAAGFAAFKPARKDALDHILAKRLAANEGYDDFSTTCYLIARYASPAILQDVQRYYYDTGKDLACAPKADLLAYLLRVAPDYGAISLRRSLQVRTTTGCYHMLLPSVAALHMTPAVEALATATLDDPDPEVAASAATTLSQYGSAGAKNALFNHLKQLHATAPAGVRDEREAALVQALLDGQSWLMNVQALRHVRELCTTTQTRELVDEYLPGMQESKIHLDYQLGDRGDWSIGRFTGHGLDRMLHKLAQFPRGTVFAWQDTSTGQDADAVYTRVQAFVVEHGMTMTHWKLPAQ